MPTTHPQRLQYLESLDSVRMTRTVGGPLSGVPVDELAELHQLQVFMEVLVTLAMGRDIVVPQSYALDSFAFVSVAEAVLDARDKASASSERPFRLHLFGEGIATYDDAVGAMLRRVHDPDRPFVSSLLPELTALEPVQLAKLIKHPEGLPSWAADDISGGLEKIRDEFQLLRPVVPRPRNSGAGFNQMLLDLVDESSAMSESARQLDPESRTVHSDLVEAVRCLDPRHPASFGQRSRLRRDAPWPSDPAGRCPRDIVGGSHQLALVTEFVDTLYNSVVVDSIGISPATFSTPVALGEQLQRSRAVAQLLALNGSRPASLLPPSGVTRDKPEPLFEVQLRPEVLRDHDRVRAQVKGLREDGLGFLTAILTERAEGRQDVHRSPFWTGLNRLDQAIANHDKSEATRALDSHLKHVAALLGGRAELGLTSKQTIQLMMTTSAGGALPAVAASTWQWPGLVSALVTGAGAVTPILVQETSNATKRWRGNRRLATSLGAFLDIDEPSASGSPL